jgi:hypothetical protein
MPLQPLRRPYGPSALLQQAPRHSASMDDALRDEECFDRLLVTRHPTADGTTSIRTTGVLFARLAAPRAGERSAAGGSTGQREQSSLDKGHVREEGATPPCSSSPEDSRCLPRVESPENVSQPPPLQPCEPDTLQSVITAELAKKNDDASPSDLRRTLSLEPTATSDAAHISAVCPAVSPLSSESQCLSAPPALALLSTVPRQQKVVFNRTSESHSPVRLQALTTDERRSPRQLPTASPLRTADCARVLRAQTRQAIATVKEDLSPRVPAAFSSPVAPGGPRSAPPAPATVGCFGAGNFEGLASPPARLTKTSAAVVSESSPQSSQSSVAYLRLVSQVQSDAADRSQLLHKIALMQQRETATRIGHQRAQEMVSTAKLNARKKIHFEKRESDVLHDERVGRDAVHREHSTTFLELTLTVREGYFRECRGGVARREHAARTALEAEWEETIRQVEEKSSQHVTFVMRINAMRNGEAQLRRHGIEGLEAQERQALRRGCTSNRFAVSFAVCRRQEGESRDSIERSCDSEQTALDSLAALSCASAVAQTLDRFRCELALCETEELISRRATVEVLRDEELQLVLARGRESHCEAQVTRLTREETEARNAICASWVSDHASMGEMVIRDRHGQATAQSQRERDERRSLHSAAVESMKEAAQDEAAAWRLLQQHRLAEWTRISGMLQRLAVEGLEEQGRQQIARECVLREAALGVMERNGVARIVLLLSHRQCALQVSGEEEDTRALLAAGHAAAKADALRRERERLLREAEQARLRALRNQAQRGAPFLGLSLAEKVTGSSFDKRLLATNSSFPSTPSTPQASGQEDAHLLVDSLVTNGPAFAAGIRLLDRVVSVAGVWSTSLLAVRSTIAQRAVVGSQVEIKVRRPPPSADDGVSDADSYADELGGPLASPSTILTFMVSVKTIDPQFREISEWFFELASEDSGERIERGAASPGYTTRRRRSIVDKMGPPRRFPPHHAAPVAAAESDASSPDTSPRTVTPVAVLPRPSEPYVSDLPSPASSVASTAAGAPETTVAAVDDAASCSGDPVNSATSSTVGDEALKPAKPRLRAAQKGMSTPRPLAPAVGQSRSLQPRAKQQR